ncbi:PAS domain-containing sensor histidine kinase [Rhodocaloribacter sp.]
MGLFKLFDAGGLLALLKPALGALAFGVAGDRGERKEAENEATESRENIAAADFYREMLRTAPVAMFVLRTDGRIAYVNEAGVNLFGASGPEEILGASAVGFLIPEDREDAWNNLRRVETGGLRTRVERTIVREDGERRNVVVYQRPIRFEGEEAVQSILIDVTERKRAQTELEEAVSLFRSTLESTADGLLVVGLDRKVVAYNERFLTLWRLDPELMEGGDARALIAMIEDQFLDPEAVLARTEAYYETPEREGFDVLRFRDGRVFERYSRPQWVGGRIVGRVWSYRDVTSRERAEKALRASEEKFSKAFRVSPVAVAISRLRDGLFIDVNVGFEALTGYTREEAIGKTANELRIWEHDDRARLFEALEREGRLRNLEVRIRTKTGEVRDCLISSEVIELEGEPCLIGITHDVSEKKRAEEALRASQEKFMRAFRSSPDSITITRLRDGMLLEVNEGFERITGFTREEAVGRTALALGLWPPGERERMMAALRASRRIRDLPLRFRVRSGETLDFLFSAEVFQWEGEPCLVAIARDVSEMRRAAGEREQLIHELEARNAELERFSYTVSHDLKSPLVTIKNFLGFLEKDLESGNDERAKRDIDHIASAADRMARLLEELLHLSRLGRVVSRSERLSLSVPAEEAAALIAGEIGRAGATVDIMPDMPVATCDPVRMVEVFQNLIGNALRFRRERQDPHIEVGARMNGTGEVLCWVRDEGMGIAPKYHEKIFGLFERLDTGAGGTGIGLALVKRIIEGHGGRVWVESEGVDRGSTFFFTLPDEGA